MTIIDLVLQSQEPLLSLDSLTLTLSQITPILQLCTNRPRFFTGQLDQHRTFVYLAEHSRTTCCSAPSGSAEPQFRIPTLSEVRHASQKAAFPSVKLAISVKKTQANLPGKLTHTTLKSDLSVLLPLAKKPYFHILFETVTYFISSQYILEAQRSSFFSYY